MPRRSDIKTILVLGSGPIVVGQAAEFDYAGTQAVKVLRAEGYRVILVNSNPATIMTDPNLADRTYIEPLTPEMLEQIIARERPEALLPTVGGQTGLNLAVDLAELGVLERYGVELIGARLPAIRTAEDRQLFKQAMNDLALPTPRSGIAHDLAEAWQVAQSIGFPLIIRPSFTLGGSGGSIAWGPGELDRLASFGLAQSPAREILLEESILGWKEYELEVLRDRADNFVVVCSIENLDPMGIHTGDSITVAPAQTLTDKEYQVLRDAAAAILRRVGVETGGSNVQFAVNPRDGRMVVVEMNPRVSRSSALASKATGFPIAKIAALLAVGYNLNEIVNDITRVTRASFEPALDYVVVKIPRWAFEKFPAADARLSPQMKSVGEAMALGRTFPEALQKAIRSLEIGRAGLGPMRPTPLDDAELRVGLYEPTKDRLFCIYQALQQGWTVQDIAAITQIDPWFLEQIASIVRLDRRLSLKTLETATSDDFWTAKRAGFSDRQLANIWNLGNGGEALVRERRSALEITPVYHRVDTCAAEFEALTPYLYSTYESECEAQPTKRRKILILGSGPNRIGQGIEFDYCCCHASFALRDMGYETIMVNCNPETVSTDYDTSDRLYFEPLTAEDVLNIVETEARDAPNSLAGVIVQFGGQTPLNLAASLHQAGVPILGTSPDSLDLAEDRQRFGRLLEELRIPMPENGTALSIEEGLAVARRIGYPLLVRPSYVLGGRGMAIVYDDSALTSYLAPALAASDGHPILLDRYLEDAIEVDVDALADGQQVVIGGVMEHVEAAGIHSGDSACVLPPHILTPEQLATLRRHTVALGLALRVVGLLNVQYAIHRGIVYVLEVNPRASRTIPFVSKATGRPLARIAAQVMAGKTLAELGVTEEVAPRGFAVKEVALPFVKFPGVDVLLGPEMKSTGEAMGQAETFGAAFAKASLGCGTALPLGGNALITVNDSDKGNIVPIARDLASLGFRLLATPGTASALSVAGLEVETVWKGNAQSPNVTEVIEGGKVALIVNTPFAGNSLSDGAMMRRLAIRHNVPYCTTLTAAAAAVEGIRALQRGPLKPWALQDTWPVATVNRNNQADEGLHQKGASKL